MGLGRAIQRSSTAPFTGGAGHNLGSNGFSGIITDGTYGGVPAYGSLPNYGEAMVNEASTLGLSAAWRCLHILTDGIGSLNMFAYDDTDLDSKVPKTPRILSDPWPMVTPAEWRGMVVFSLVMHGNAYLLPYDMDPRTGYPRQLIIVHPDQMHVSLRDGRPEYRLEGPDGQIVDCLHIRGLMTPGAICGIGIIEAQREGIRRALDIERYQGGNFRESSVPPVIIKVNRPEISEQQALDIQSKWVNKHGYGNRTPAVMPTSMDVETLAWSPSDTQFLESKQYTAAEICWWFGIDPRVLGLSASGQSLTYANVESTYVDLQRMSFQPWTSKIEAALSRVMPRSQMARFDFSPMLRSTLGDRYSAYKIGLDGGWLTVDEVRALENLGPLDASGNAVTITSSTGAVETLKNETNSSLPKMNSTSEVYQ